MAAEYLKQSPGLPDNLSSGESGAKVMRKRRWWQERCPWDWRDNRTAYHVHYCHYAAETVRHTHTCDCGETYDPVTGSSEPH